MQNSTNNPEETEVEYKKFYFGLCGHYTLTTPPNLNILQDTLDEIGYELKFWKIGPTPHYLVRRQKAARLGELRKKRGDPR